MARKSLFERIGLVEKINEIPDYDVNVNAEESYEKELPEVNVEGVTQENLQENLVAEIYNASGLSDMSNSIFKIEEINKNLPTTMPADTKKASIIGILHSFNLTTEELLEDAFRRTQNLSYALMQITNENTDIINAKKQEIEDAKRLIEQCEKTIAEHENVIAISSNVIDTEVKRVTALKNFLGGN